MDIDLTQRKDVFAWLTALLILLADHRRPAMLATPAAPHSRITASMFSLTNAALPGNASPSTTLKRDCTSAESRKRRHPYQLSPAV